MAPLKTAKEDNHKTNRIKIAFGEILEIEVESEDLSFIKLKEQALDLLEVAKKTALKAPVNIYETA